jgi:outer membrane protein assembly factor BamB
MFSMRSLGLPRSSGPELNSNSISRKRAYTRAAVRFSVIFALTFAILHIGYHAIYGAGTVLLGDQAIEAQVDSNPTGQAEAFQTTGTVTGTLSSITFYVDANSGASSMAIGLYADNAGHPGTLLTQASSSAISTGAWNTVAVPNVSVTSGTKYWFAILGTGSGTPRFRDHSSGSCSSEASSQSNLSALPATWSSGSTYTDCPLSAYGSAKAATTPILSLSTTTLSFAATQGGANPPSATVNISNTGSGTLTYTVTSDQTWLNASPVTGTAPQTLTVSVATGTLLPGSYTGHLTVTATGAQGSPGTITVTFIVSAPPPPQPILSVTPTVLSFGATQGGGNPPTQLLSVTNAGSGTLNFSVATDQTWLTASPVNGSAPQTLTVGTVTGSLATGTYTGHVTVTAAGVQGSPANVTVTFVLSNSSAGLPGDWLMIGHDPARTGFASDETTLGVGNASSLAFRWRTTVDGQVTAQPLFAGNVQISGASHDVVISATSGNSIYALDAQTGAQLWKRNFGSQPSNCVLNGGFGITGAPLIDRSVGSGRIYAVSDDGQLRTISLIDGTDVALPLPVIATDTVTNKVWGGLNLVGRYLYVPTASDGCDDPPWRGRVFGVDVSGTTPVLANTFTVVPSIAAPNGGGGIWGYGGVAVDKATGNVYAGTGQDSNSPETFTPYSDRMLALDSSLNLLGSFQASHPNSFPCNGAPCDLDFGSTPVVFTPPSCPTMVAEGNKNGLLYLFKVADLAANGQPLQSLVLNSANDSLGAGGIGGTPVYWPNGNMLFVADTGPGATGFSGGLVALTVQTDCTLKSSWSVALGGNNLPNSSPTVANGVVFIGEASNGVIHAYNASTGTQLWTSGTSISGTTFAAPMVANGSVYVGSWNGFAANSGGTISAFSVGTVTGPVLGVAPTSLTFSATQGGVNPASATVNVSNTGSGSLSYSVSSDQTWLSASPASGTAPQSLTVSVATGSLAAGTYTGHLTISATGALGSPTTVTVTFTVTAPPPPQPILTVTPGTLTFAATTGGANPASKSISVTNTGSGSLNFTIATDQTWLTASPLSGSAPQTITVNAVTGTLAVGTYTGHVTVTSTGVQGSPASVTVTFTVSAASAFLLGTQSVLGNRDSNGLGQAEAFQTTAVASGPLSSLSLYLDASNSATRLTLGLYTDNAGHPGTLLTQATTTTIASGTWNTLTVPSVSITSGTKYWIAILGSSSGSFQFRDNATATCGNEGSSQTNLTTLPTTWTTGQIWSNCPVSGYGK